MKRLHLRRPGRGALLVGLCLLALIPLALAPALLLRLTDLYTMGRVQAVAEPYAPQTQSMEDFYLLRQLAQRGQALRGGSNAALSSDIYAPAASYRSSMSIDTAMGTYALDLMQEMADAGALPESWLEALGGLVGQRETGYDNGYFYYSNDSLGFIRINAYNGGWGSHLLFSMTVESHTGRVVQLWLGLPADSGTAAPADARALLEAFVAYNGLDTLGDWAPPEGSAYAENGLYSAAGQVLAACACYDFSYNGTELFAEADFEGHSQDVPAPASGVWPYTALSLSLSWSAETPMPLTSGPQREALPYAIGELQPLDAAGGDSAGKAAGDGSALYELAEWDGQSGVLLRTDYETMDREIYCSVAGCPHTALSCPARLPYNIWRGQQGLFLAGSRLWLLYDAGTDEEQRAAERQYLMDALGLESEEQLDETAKQEPELFLTGEYGYHFAQTQPNTLELVEPGGRTVVRTLPDGVDWRWHDEEAIFGLRLDRSAGTAALVRVPFAGDVTETPLPSPELLLRAEQIKACGSKLLLALSLTPVPDPDPDLRETAQDSLEENLHTALVCYDPATGASEQLRKSETGTALGIAGAWPGRMMVAEVSGGNHVADIYYGVWEAESLTACRLPENGPLQIEGYLYLPSLADFVPHSTVCRTAQLPGGDWIYIYLSGSGYGAGTRQSAHFLFSCAGRMVRIPAEDALDGGLTFLDRLPDGRFVVQYTDDMLDETWRAFLSPGTGALDGERTQILIPDV